MPGVARTAIAIDQALLTKFDRWMARHGYTNRSEALRDLIRAALVDQQWQDPKARVVACLSIIYEHHRRELSGQLTDLQHEDHHVILCSQHVHLDQENCLEVIIMQGAAGQLRRIADAIISMRGVKAGRISLLSRNV